FQKSATPLRTPTTTKIPHSTATPVNRSLPRAAPSHCSTAAPRLPRLSWPQPIAGRLSGIAPPSASPGLGASPAGRRPARPVRHLENGGHHHRKEAGEGGRHVARREEQRHRLPVGPEIATQQPEEAAEISHARRPSPTRRSTGRNVRIFSGATPSAVSFATSDSGRSKVATTTASQSPSATSATSRTGIPMNSPPARAPNTAAGSTPPSFSVRYASSAASSVPYSTTRVAPFFGRRPNSLRRVSRVRR